MTYRINIDDFVKDIQKKIPGYLGAILIGSESTGYIDKNSDIDIHFFVDSSGTTDKFTEVVNGINVNCTVYLLNTIYKKIKYKAHIGSFIMRRMYLTQGKIIDDPYEIVIGIQKEVKDTSIKKKHTLREIDSIKRILMDFSDIVSDESFLSSEDIYDVLVIEKYLFEIFQIYSSLIGYDATEEFSISFWKKAKELFYNKDYAKNHRGKEYPDMIFLDIWEDAYIKRDKKSLQILIDYIFQKLTDYVLL